MKRRDACIIPYTLEEPIRDSSPLKLDEYVATGKSIVSVNIAQAARFEPLVRIAGSVRGWERAIIDALSEDKYLSQKRLEVAHQNSWSIRAKDVLFILKNTLDVTPQNR